MLVVIIGAGLAGLAAAQRLLHHGFSNIMILEAQDRIGGRIHTIDHSDFIIELGAQWLHGAENNPLYYWMLDRNLLEDPEEADTEMTGLYCTNDGQMIEQKLVEKVFDITIKSKRNLSKNLYEDIINRNGFTIASDVFKHELDKAIALDSYLEANKALVYPLFDWFLRYETIDNCCNSMNEVSIQSYTGWSDWDEGTLVNFKSGYHSLVKCFVDNLPMESLRLCKNVTKIALASSENKENLVEVHFVDTLGEHHNSDDDDLEGISSNGKLLCDHVIFTGSLGFLKENHIKIFEPALPKNKIELINSIGFGTVNKIFLRFEQPFWGDQPGIKIVWTQKDKDRGEFPEWVYDITAFDVVRRQPNLLVGWIGGNGAKLMELETSETVAAVCKQILDKFWPKSLSVPSKLVECICSRWNSNAFIRGSYSFQSMESFHFELDDLHEPIYTPVDGDEQAKPIPRIMFAGEATSGDLYSTTHGAIVSGWREADRLIKLYEK